MTPTDKEAVERMPVLRAWQASRHQAGPFQVPEYEDFAAIVQEHEALAAALDTAAQEIAALKAAAVHFSKELDAAEAARAAVAAALVTFVDLNLEMFGNKHAILDPSALSDTDALAEYVERVRAEERERCLNLVPDGSDEWYENLQPVHVKRMLAVLRAAIRQETNDG